VVLRRLRLALEMGGASQPTSELRKKGRSSGCRCPVVEAIQPGNYHTRRSLIAHAIRPEVVGGWVKEDVAGTAGVFFGRLWAAMKRFGFPPGFMDTPLAETLDRPDIEGGRHGGPRVVSRGCREIQFHGLIYAGMGAACFPMPGACVAVTRGRFWSCPMVVRTPQCAGIHAQSITAKPLKRLFATIFLACAWWIPSSPPAGAYVCLLAAIADPDPVIFLEPARLYRSVQRQVPDERQTAALDHLI